MKIKEQFDDSFSGIIWINNSEIKKSEPTFRELNYLLDGVLSHSYSLFQNEKTNLFFGEQFGQRFFLIHLNCLNNNRPDFKQQLSNTVDTLIKSSESKLKILLISPDDVQVNEALKKIKKIELISLEEKN